MQLQICFAGLHIKNKEDFNKDCTIFSLQPGAQLDIWLRGGGARKMCVILKQKKTNFTNRIFSKSTHLI